MRLMLTGSPGVGKSSVAKELGKILNCRVVNEKEFAIERGIGKWDCLENELVIPLQKFAKEMAKLLAREQNIIIEGHILCELKLKVDFVVVLRLHPELLEARLEMRGYSAEKIQDNVFCEGIDYCKKHVMRNYSPEKIIEVHVKKTIKETTQHILDELRERSVL